MNTEFRTSIGREEASPPCLIRVEAVTKVYHRDSIAIPVLEGIDITVASGAFLALQGPSGSGKTTLLNLIGGVDKPTSGTVTVAGTEITRLGEGALARWRARHIGFIFQFYHLIPVLTAYQNVALPLSLTRLSRKERDEHVRTALAIVGLEDRMEHFPRQLSGGQEQRVAIARAVVTDPTLLLADEPTGDLDARSAEEILVLMERLNKEFGKTIVLVTHDPRAASRADEIRHLDKGVLV
ncbi:MAG: ABC transporter ATP-binding protein [Acidobacteriota bacterium]